MKRTYERATCPLCGRRVAAYVPFMADGSDVKLMPHLECAPASSGKIVPNYPCAAGGKMLTDIMTAELVLKVKP